MAERDDKGRFVKASAAEFGRRGGLARAARRTPEELSEIAMMGMQALADRLFDGDLVKAARWMTERGRAGRVAAQDGEMVE